MASNWETYTGGEFVPNGGNKGLSISINRLHRITFNKAAYELLGRPDALVLRFIRAESIIGVVPANLRTIGALPLRDSNGVSTLYLTPPNSAGITAFSS